MFDRIELLWLILIKAFQFPLRLFIGIALEFKDPREDTAGLQREAPFPAARSVFGGLDVCILSVVNHGLDLVAVCRLWKSITTFGDAILVSLPMIGFITPQQKVARR